MTKTVLNALIGGGGVPNVLSLRREHALPTVTPKPNWPMLPTKWIENRTWQVPCLGPLLIHASGPGGGIVGAVFVQDIICTFGREDEDCQQTIRRLKTKVRDVYQNAAVKIPAQLNWSVADDPCMMDGPLYWWLLSYPVKFEREIPCKGQLRIWQPTSEIITQVREQIRTSR